MDLIFNMIPLSVPNIAGNEWKYVKECLDTGWVSSAGPFVSRFEEEICSYVGGKFAVGTVNGTAALHIALLVSGIQPNDEVIVPTITFVAPVNVVRYVGAFPVFMDCDEYFNLDVEKLLDFLKNETVQKGDFCYNRGSGRRISAIIPVHVFGNPVNLEPLLPELRKRNIRIIEDATESLGSHYVAGTLSGKYTGTIGSIGCFSFNGNKIITTGGGGMLVTDDEDVARKAKYLTTQAKDDPVRYIHNEIGYNYRLTNVQAAIGLAQLEQLDGFIRRKREIFHLYQQLLANEEHVRFMGYPRYASPNFWLGVMEMDFDSSKHRDSLMECLGIRKIQTRPVWYPNHLQKPFRRMQAYRIEKAPEKVARALNLPSSSSLKDEEVQFVVQSVKDCIRSISSKGDA